MADIELFGKYYNIKDFYCGEKIDEIIPCKPGVILYIRIQNKCNGKCKFCLNCQNKSDSNINLEKLKYVIKYLTEKDILAKVTITGGEPMLNPEYLNQIINAIVEIRPDIKISISTNGTNLEKILELNNKNNIEYIHVSRHHYNDKINEEILGTTTVSSQVIRDMQNKLKNIVINTVMCKNYIDSPEAVDNMCKYVLNLGVERIHLVSLINYNKWCVSNYVDVNEVLKNAEGKEILTKKHSLYRKKFCECHYYQYKNNNIFDFTVMSRLTHKNSCDYVEQLVYTNDNCLLSGFDSETVII